MEQIRALKASGVTCIYVSRRIDEIFELCDNISVLRDGRHVGTVPVKEASKDSLIQMMVGRTFADFHAGHKAADDAPEQLRVENLSSPGKFQPLSFGIRRGEVLGMAGLVGSGRTEVSEALFGLDKRRTGKIFVGGKETAVGSPEEAMACGIGLVPEDRKRHGLVLEMSSSANISLAVLEKLSRWGWISSSQESLLAEKYFIRMKVKAPSPSTPAVSLSGGNQQKLVMAKWLASNSRILIVDEPTRGVDVGAKAEIHRLLDELAEEGCAILLISSELEELLKLADRILVMREGRMNGEFRKCQVDQEKLLKAMTRNV